MSKKLFILGEALIIVMLLNACGRESANEEVVEEGKKEKIRITKKNIIAHCGFWNTKGSLRNTQRALVLADSLGVYGSEFDVQLTVDNVPVIHHDNTIMGISIHRSEHSKIKDIVLSNRERLPTLEQFLIKGTNLSIKLILELKPQENPKRDSVAAEIIVGMIKQYGMEDRVEFISFSEGACKQLIRLTKSYGGKVALLSLDGNIPPDELSKQGYSGMAYTYNTMKAHPEYFDRAKKLGLAVKVWTVDDTTNMLELLELGTNQILTDTPVVAR